MHCGANSDPVGRKCGTGRPPFVYGAIKGNKLVLQGNPHGRPDMSMLVENDEFTLRYGKCVLMKVAAESHEILEQSSYIAGVLEIVRSTVFHEEATFDSNVTIRGSLTVDGPMTVFKNIRRVSNTDNLLQLFIDPCSGEIVAKQ